ncbi:MAG: YncE family protein, partial [Bryobacteraceae bacterium]|nr:YncE family protein [Bryobacteraceae bacterium]
MRTAAVLLVITTGCVAQTLSQPSRAVSDPGVVTTRQSITPAGAVSVFQGRVYGLGWAGNSGEELVVLHASDVYRMDWRNNRVKERVAHGGSPGNQSIYADPRTGEVWIGQSVRDGGRNGSPKARLVAVDGKTVRPVASGLGSFQPGSFAVSQANAGGRRLAVVPLVWENKLAVIDVASGEVLKQVATGIAPFAAVVNAKGTVAYVSNLGGRPPRPNELSGSPVQKPDEKVTVDARGIASTGTISVVDLEKGETVATLAVGLHPTALALDEARGRLYVANGNSESISVVDTARRQVVRTIALQPFTESVRGIAPTALAVSADGKQLYAACGGINAVAVIASETGTLLGMIPT